MATPTQDASAKLAEMLDQPKPKAPRKAKPKAAAKPKVEAKPVEVVVPKGSMRPEALAKEIGISGKNLRGWLRKTHPRAAEQKNTAWIIPANIVKEAKQHFAKQEAK